MLSIAVPFNPSSIGGLSRTATSALRQLLDAGTLSNLPAGFKQRGIRIVRRYMFCFC